MSDDDAAEGDDSRAVSVREATPADAVGIRDAHLAAIEGLGGQAYDDRQVAAWAHDRDPGKYPVGEDEAYLVVAERDGDAPTDAGGSDGDGEAPTTAGRDDGAAAAETPRIVGFGWLSFEAGDYFARSPDGEVVAVYVRPAVARAGVGTRLYRRLEARARDAGLGSLGLWASLNAVAFYRAMGYQRVTDHRYEFADGVTGAVVEMHRRLDSDADADGRPG